MIGLLVGLAMLRPVPATPPVAPETGLPIVVNDSAVNVYAESSLFAAPIHRAFRGEPLILGANQGIWNQVTLSNGRTGWVMAGSVSTRRVWIDSRTTTLRAHFSPRPPVDRSGEYTGALKGYLAGCGLVIVLDGAIFGLLVYNDLSLPGGGGMSSFSGDVVILSAFSTGLIVPVSAALGTYLAARKTDPGGNYWNTLRGAALCGTAGAALGLLADGALGSPGLVTLLGAALGTMQGAVWGYNLDRTRPSAPPLLGNHLLPPTIGISMARSKTDNPNPGIVLNLVNWTF